MKINSKSTALVVNSNGMSNSDQELSSVLLTNYLNLLIEEELFPNAILFYGSGVKTVVEGSKFIDSLDTLEKKGVNLIVCKTCLNYYNLLDKVKVGKIGTMADIVHYQWSVGKVITL